ncbi:MAG: DUF3488 and DUF4129 domain-containing transglutaminase family protein [Jaaginema sp. PMC 1080.18]|nr:DUF3488 and DUF4129 domain-containing transglutaminase family protein [Jaaginema sp. PMC 1080.18]MEC4866610.1 DUF3488 and DUF4129 domain-containing transglutaminase family protein [Jaaginema sp. PMC 1078.18]
MNGQTAAKPTSWQQRWQRFLAIQKSTQIEESLLLRILVQVLVIVGIIATDIAAETAMSFWAVPLSLLGGFCSWYRRYKPNITLKFAISIGMLLALGMFFQNLLASANDTRLVLATLLIQLQILHSFHLPRRTDLGYSMLIGLILLGVAATLSETLTFAPMLVLFLVVGLPTLILDYRSRLGLTLSPTVKRESRQTPKAESQTTLWSQHSPLSLRRLSLMLALIVSLGLALFALMPRFPGYQQFTFPVSGAGEMENSTFNPENRGIFNPGVRSGGQGAERDGLGGEGGENGEGEGDLYYGFQSEINQGRSLGKPSQPKVLLRVRSQAPGFWRMLAFDRYTGQGWAVSRDEQLQMVERPSWTYRFFLSSSYGLPSRKEVTQTYTVVESLPNVIPALYDPHEIYFPTTEIGIDPEGSLRSPSALIGGMTYTVISEVPYRDLENLRQAGTKYTDAIQKYYLQIPPVIEDSVRDRAETLLAKADREITSPYEKALYLAQALKQTYQIQEFPELAPGQDLVTTFIENGGGYDDHFATVLTVMLRSLGIPARLTTGFGTGQFNPFTGFYLIRNTDAYALTEVYIPDWGWYTFDPVPGREIIPPSFEESQTFSVLRQFWHWVAGWLPSPVTGFIGYIGRTLASAIATILGWLWAVATNSWLGAMIVAILAIGVALLAWLVWTYWRRWRYAHRLQQLPPMERLYRQMLDRLAATGDPKHPAQTPLEYARQVQQQYETAQAEIIAEISQAYVHWRYGGQQQNIVYLQQQLKLLKNSLNRRQKTVVATR